MPLVLQYYSVMQNGELFCKNRVDLPKKESDSWASDALPLDFHSWNTRDIPDSKGPGHIQMTWVLIQHQPRLLTASQVENYVVNGCIDTRRETVLSLGGICGQAYAVISRLPDRSAFPLFLFLRPMWVRARKEEYKFISLIPCPDLAEPHSRNPGSWSSGLLTQKPQRKEWCSLPKGH